MHWTWPSWLAILLGVVAAAAGFATNFQTGAIPNLGPALIIAGALLMAAGLHALQGAWTACCGYDRCDCEHCGACSSGDCCGKCDCYGGDSGEKGHSR